MALAGQPEGWPLAHDERRDAGDPAMGRTITRCTGRARSAARGSKGSAASPRSPSVYAHWVGWLMTPISVVSQPFVCSALALDRPRRPLDPRRRPPGSSNVPALSFRCPLALGLHRVSRCSRAPRSDLTRVGGRCDRPAMPGSLGRWSQCCAAGRQSWRVDDRDLDSAHDGEPVPLGSSSDGRWSPADLGSVLGSGDGIWQGTGPTSSDDCQRRARAEPVSRPIAAFGGRAAASALMPGRTCG